MSKRKITKHNVHLIQDLIEKCLQIYMHPPQIVDTLFHRAKIAPGVTELMLKRLENQNPEFFRLYYMRLIVKEQIIRFNQVLQQQAEIMSKMIQNEIVTTPLTKMIQNEIVTTPLAKMIQNEIVTTPLANGSQIQHSNYQQQIPEIPLKNVPHMTNVMPNFYANGEESWQQDSMHDAVGMQGRHTMLLTKGSNVGTINGFNGVYSPVMFGADNGVGETSIPPYVGGISNTSTIEELLAVEDFVYWQSTQMTRGFSLTGSTTDCNNTDIFANISLSPLVESDENIDESNVAADINRR